MAEALMMEGSIRDIMRIFTRTIETDARGNGTYYAYNGINRLGAIIDSLGEAAYYEYDAKGNLAVSLDAEGQAAYFAYDGADRQVSIVYTDGRLVYFSYDAAGNLTGVADERGVTSQFFDVLNRLSARALPTGQNVYYEYDAVGNLTRLTYPLGAGEASYTFDKASRITSVVSPAPAL